MRKNAHCSRCSQLPRRKRKYSVDLAQFSVPPGETQVLYLPWLPIPSDISLYSVRTPEVSLLAATPQLLEWLPRDRDSEQHHRCGTAQSLPSDLPLPSPHSSKATAVVASLAFNWQRSSWFGAFSPLDFFQKSLSPHSPSAPAVTVLSISKRSCLKAHMDMAVAELSLSDLVCLAAEQVLNSLCTSWLRKPWLDPHSQIPDDEEPIFSCSLAVSPFTSASVHSASPFPFQNFQCRGHEK